MAVHFFSCGACMNRSAGAAAKLPESERKHLGVRALAGSDTISALAEQLDVSRKFVYGQAHKADVALDNVFSPAVPDDDVLFHLPVTRTWLRQATLARINWRATCARSPSGSTTTFWRWPVRCSPRGKRCSTSSSRSWALASLRMP